MNRILVLLLSFVLFSCKDYVEKPNNLIGKSEMAEIIADFALQGQIENVAVASDKESETRYILNKHKVKGQDFTDSYKYYTITKELDGILEDSKDVILDISPEAKKYIEEKKKDTLPLPGSPLQRSRDNIDNARENATKNTETKPLKKPKIKQLRQDIIDQELKPQERK